MGLQERVGARIRERRRQHGLSQAALGQLLGVSEKTVQRWEKGKSFPTYGNILALAEALGCSEEQLLCGFGAAQ